jgi:hypothetical protein
LDSQGIELDYAAIFHSEAIAVKEKLQYKGDFGIHTHNIWEDF